METTLKTAPVLEPVTLDEVKNHMRLDLEIVDHDDYLTGLISSVRKEIEELTWRKLITQSWYVFIPGWPSIDYIELPFGSLSSVTTIKHKDTDGDQTTWDSDEYIVGTDYQRGRVTLAYGYTWPNETLYPSNPIEIDMTCGYGAARNSVPEPLRQAIKVLCAERFENREDSIVGITFSKMDTVANLIAPYRLNQL